jgi:hypothetical protein
MKRISILILAAGLWLPPLFSGEIVDGVAAVVNQEIITLTDVRIVRSFQILEDGSEDADRRHVLHRLIERKLLLQLAGQEDAVIEAEINAYIDSMKERIGNDRYQQLLQSFGMTSEDLREYVREAVLYKLILAERFSQAVVVSLKEMEDYYQNVYLPGLEEGREPQTMLDILDEIETAIRQEKIQSRVKEWIDSLKEQADIQMLADEYPEFFNLNYS